MDVISNDVYQIASGSPLKIEAASWRDLGPVRQLEQVCFPQDAWPLLDMLGVLSFPSIVRYKAIQSDAIIGFVAGDVKRFQGVGWIASICVHPEYRNQGLGTRLLHICESQMQMPRVRLTVRHSNEGAIEMYRRNGYAQVGVWKRYYKGGEDGAVMEKTLRK